MSEVNVNIQVIHPLATQMRDAAARLTEIQKELFAKYRDAGKDWRDQRYRELGDIVSECGTAIVNMQMVLQEGAESLRKLEKAIGEYEAVNIIPTGAGSGFHAGGKAARAKDYNAYLLKYGLSETSDFGILEERTIRDMCQAIAETKDMFPELDLKFVGSMQSRNIHLREELTKAYLEEYRDHYKGASDEELMPFVAKNVEEDLQGFEPDENTIAQSLFLENAYGRVGKAAEAFNGITVNEQVGASYDYFVSIRRADVEAGWKPQNCISPKATMDHELGHQIANYVNAHKDGEIQNLFAQFSRLDRQQKGQVLSGYAGVNIHEFIAEAWSEYRNNPECRECARSVAKRVIALYKAGGLLHTGH